MHYIINYYQQTSPQEKGTSLNYIKIALTQQGRNKIGRGISLFSATGHEAVAGIYDFLPPPCISVCFALC